MNEKKKTEKDLASKRFNSGMSDTVILCFALYCFFFMLLFGSLLLYIVSAKWKARQRAKEHTLSNTYTERDWLKISYVVGDLNEEKN